MSKNTSWRRSCIKRGLIGAMASAGLAAGMVGCMAAGGVYAWRSRINEAKALDNYRMEELEKVQKKFDNGEISKSDFDIRVSFINGTKDVSVVRNIWVEEGHEDCCEKLYKTSIDQGLAAVGLVFAGVAAAAGTGISAYYSYEWFKG